ncbi:hypothetical protein L6452_21479 [Arctium lappa]|uniref:Uncharacterized protein n=1 Tax=Arctium lappa TaxID=4217 RepID=A0ACB9AXI0_ARCLA|nr:hypothetical protein L6452_21479 [Arctium lappa]
MADLIIFPQRTAELHVDLHKSGPTSDATYGLFPRPLRQFQPKSLAGKSSTSDHRRLFSHTVIHPSSLYIYIAISIS